MPAFEYPEIHLMTCGFQRLAHLLIHKCHIAFAVTGFLKNRQRAIRQCATGVPDPLTSPPDVIAARKQGDEFQIGPPE